MYPPAPGETGTVGVIDCKVRHIAGDHWSLCGRWWAANLWGVRTTHRAALPLCKKCKSVQNDMEGAH